MYSSLAIANFLVNYSIAVVGSNSFSAVSANHIVYAAHSDYLLEFDRPLISEPVLATQLNGPIIPRLYRVLSCNFPTSGIGYSYRGIYQPSVYIDRKTSKALTQISVLDCKFLMNFHNKFTPDSYQSRFCFIKQVCGTGTPWSEIYSDIDIETIKKIMSITHNKKNSLKHLKKLVKNHKSCPKISNSMMVASDHKFSRDTCDNQEKRQIPPRFKNDVIIR